MVQGSGGNQELELLPWDWERLIPAVSQTQAKYSRGFLRCKPEKWFPGFGMQWLPLAHSLGVELEFQEAIPSLETPADPGVLFVGSIDDEPIGIAMDPAAAKQLVEAVVPGSESSARNVTLEYLARRFLASLAISWSGPESSVIQFEPDLSSANMRGVGSIQLTFTLNGNPSMVTVFLGKVMVERLDGLWRRQLKSTSKQSQEDLLLHFEVAHLTVPPSMLTDYLQAGTNVDLEVPLSNSLTLVSSNGTCYSGRMCNIEGQLGFSVQGGPAGSSGVPEGTVRLSIEMGTVTLNPGMIPELSQDGAYFDTGIELSDQVQMVVNGEQVGKALLCSYQGNFAVSVV